MCEHENFDVEANVNRITDIHAFALDVHVKCVECGKPFLFLGMPGGLSINQPTVSADCEEARLPIIPKGEQVTYDSRFISFRIKKPL